MSEIKAGLWQNTLDGSYIKVVHIDASFAAYNEDDCKYRYTMSINELVSCYKPVEAEKPAPAIDDTFNAGKKVYGPIQLRTSEWSMGPYEEKVSTPMRLIGIAGPARAGKDTLCSYMLDNLDGIWLRLSFADPLKEMLRAIGVDCSDDAKAVVSDDYGVTPRHMMQTLGTEWGRNLIDGDIWVKAFARLNAGKCVIVPDVRFENEAELVREHGVLIHLVGRGGIEGNHVSENAIEFKPGDIVIDNSRDLAWLHAQVDSNAVLGEFVSAE